MPQKREIFNVWKDLLSDDAREVFKSIFPQTWEEIDEQLDDYTERRHAMLTRISEASIKDVNWLWGEMVNRNLVHKTEKGWEAL